MTYIVLIMMPILIGFFAYKTFRKDILSPTIITTVSFTIAILCAIVGLLSWNYVGNLSISTIFLIYMGIFSFFLGEYCCRKFYTKKFDNIKTKEGIKINSISRIVLFAMLVLVIFTTILLYFEIKNICAKYGYYENSLSKLLSFYRTKTSLFNATALNSSIQVSFIVKQMQKVCNAINIIVFAYGINLFFRCKKNNDFSSKKVDLILIISIVVTALMQTLFFNGGRSIMFHYFMAYFAIFVYYYFYIYKHKLDSSILKKTIMFMIILLVAFNLMLPLLGRQNRHNPITYTSFSLGTSIPSLDLYFQTDNSKSDNFGEQTFTGIYYTLNKFGIIKYDKAESHEWYAFDENGKLSSNTFTSLRSYYKDFGFLGVIVLQFVFGFLITLLYLIMKNRKSELLFIIYFNYFYILIDQIRDEQFFSLITISTIANIFLIVVTYYFLIFLEKKVIKCKELIKK